MHSVQLSRGFHIKQRPQTTLNPSTSQYPVQPQTTPPAIQFGDSPSPRSQSEEPASPAEPPRAFSLSHRNFNYASGVKLENEFIRSLQHTTDPIQKAGIVELLGRAHSINALPKLVPLLEDSEPVEVRTAATNAISQIAATTHPNSYTATEITDTLLEAYKHRKEKLAERLREPLKKLSYDNKMKETEDRQALMNELKSLMMGISELNVVDGRATLQDEYRKTVVMNQMNESEVQEMIRATELAEEEFHKELEKKYQKPIREILKQIPPDELENLKSKVKIETPKGETINLLEAQTQIAFLKEQHEQFATELLRGLMDALSLHNDKESSASMKMALTNSTPDIKAKALKILSKRNGLNYNSDVYPNLYARDEAVRKAALKALLNSQELSAKQKTLELLKPRAFMDLMGGMSSNGLQRYAKFLTRIAENGDEYIDALSNRALHSDYDLETRQISLVVLGMMTQQPAVHDVSPETLIKARATIKALSLHPPARNPEDFEALSLTATQMWVNQRDPDAVAAAIIMADSKNRRLSGKDQESLLGAVFNVLQKDKKLSESERQSEQQHTLLDVMRRGNNPGITAEEEKTLREGLLPKRTAHQLSPQTVEEFEEENSKADGNPGLIEELAPEAAELRPFLTRLAESDKSSLAQMLSMRIMGLLQDKKTIPLLKERIKDPLKGKINWNAEVSYAGNPATAAANLRLNALAALGDIGDSKALDVMTDALDDPILKRFVSDPLAKIAPSVNEKMSEAKIAKLRTKLVRLMENPDGSRSTRAQRMSAANTLFQFRGGPEEIRDFAARTTNPNFKRHALSALITNNHGLEVDHPDFELVKDMLGPGLGIERLHARGITGKGVQMAIVDGGYVDKKNEEGFQNRVKLPAQADDPESSHPTMVMSTAAANGKLKGVAPDAVIFSDKWPDFQSSDPMDVYKKIIEGKLRGENDVRVINNSWGFSNNNAMLHKDVRQLLKEYKNVVDMAEKAGIQMVFAAGNEGEAANFPKLGTLSAFGIDVDKLTDEQKKQANYILDKVIVVGALNTQGSNQRNDHVMAEFSSQGDSLNRMAAPTVIAPGADMMVYSWDKYKGNPKSLVNGTSFASPFVSGLITLMVQANPNITPAEIRTILKKSAKRLPEIPISQQGSGEVNPESAVKMAESYASKKRKTPDFSGESSGPLPIRARSEEAPTVASRSVERPGKRRMLHHPRLDVNTANFSGNGPEHSLSSNAASPRFGNGTRANLIG